MSKYLFSLLFVVLIAFNIYLLLNYRQLQVAYKLVYQESEQLKYINEIQAYTVKDLLETNIMKKPQRHEIGIRLNKNACFTCNKYTVSLIKNNFNSESICFVLNKKDSVLVDMLNLNGNKVSAQKTVVNIKEEGFYISTKH